MEEGRAKRLTKYLKGYDSLLKAKADYDSVKVYRKNVRYSKYEIDGVELLYAHAYDSYICALTTNWNIGGHPVDWSFDKVLDHIKRIDIHNGFNESVKIIESLENDYEVRSRHMHNKIEDMAREARPVFKKVFADVNTASMEKLDKRRIRDGYRK